jgi:alanyl-tRNA synthetase
VLLPLASEVGGADASGPDDAAPVPVVAVVEEGERVLHVLGGPLLAPRVRGRVDPDRRRDHRQQHHGQHLLSRAFQDLFGAHTTSFHLGAEVSSIDLDRAVSGTELTAAERRTNEVIQDARPVAVRTVTRVEAEALGVVVPEGSGDAVRLVEAEGFDLQPCGGTHPRSTGEVGCVAISGHEKYKGGSRVRFLCGERALRALHTQSAVLDRLAAQLSAPHAALPEAVQRLLDQGLAARKAHEGLLERALALEAKALYQAATSAGSSPPVVVARQDDRGPEELQGLAQALLAVGPCVALLGAAAEGKVQLVFAQSKGAGRDIPALLKAALVLVGGRGGGKGDLARGGGDRVEGLDAALAQAAAEAASPLRG